MKQSSGGGRLESLDGLRGVLAVYVCLYHLMNSLPALKGNISGFTALMGQGWVAVDIFFALSGFVMCYVYGSTFSGGVTWPDFGKFMWTRFMRLYPVHLFTLMVMVLVLVPFAYRSEGFFTTITRYSLPSAIASVFMLQGPWLPIRTWNYPSWSISVEWHLYLIFPFVFRFLRSKQICAALLIALPIAAVALYTIGLGGAIGSGLVDFESFPTNGPIALVRGVMFFVVGMSIYHWRDVPLCRSNGVMLAVFLTFFACLQFEDSAAFAALMIAPLIAATMQNDVVRFVLSRAPFLFLGRISYSLYMVHALVQVIVVNRIVALAFGGEIGAGAAIPVLLLGFVLSLIAGSLVHRYIELPCRRALQTWSDRSQRQLVAD